MGSKRARTVPRRWVFTTAQIAEFLGLSPTSTRKMIYDAVKAGTLVVGDLESLVGFLATQKGTMTAVVARVVSLSGGDMAKAAAALGVSRATLYRRAKGTD
jgi:transcriptional regulator of acetoin/glycerol metabolism